MNKTTHRIYIGSLVSFNVLVLIYLIYKGYSYYTTPLEERFFHDAHGNLKPSGVFGQGYGIIGSLIILIGVFGYIARKKYKFLAQFGRLKYWLEFHIFLCTLGPMLILFHTAFKFGGLVSISFWSMVLVVLSGVIGRFIYIRIPRTIEGRELSLNEAIELKQNLAEIFREKYQLDAAAVEDITQNMSRPVFNQEKKSGIKNWFSNYFDDRKRIGQLRNKLTEQKLENTQRKQIIKLVRNEINLNNKIESLLVMQKLFKHWHVVHLPFALIMLIIMIIHVIVTIALGYKWIF